MAKTELRAEGLMKTGCNFLRHNAELPAGVHAFCT
jgi:hypothetical protein